MLQHTPNINFLSRYKNKLLIQSRRAFFIQTACLTILGLYAGIFMFLGGYSVFLHVQNKQLEQRKRSEIAILERLVEVESKYVALKQKTSGLTAIADSMEQHKQLIEATLTMIPEGLSVSGVSIGEGGVIRFSVSSYDPDVVKAFFDTLSNKSTIKGVRSVEMADISRVAVNAQGQYSFSVEIKLNLSLES